ncbi:hypothetical protein LCGC14_1129310 [marine sediment metagenome]|uniref:Uncharacterized protein n=1 Tax=marine sediment metagenome TaxID=412755 RepID=A0A0F9Q7F1_9ZZZZ
MGKDKKFEKVVEGWSNSESFYSFMFCAFLLFSIYFTIYKSAFWVFSSIGTTICVLIAFDQFLERKVYWREMK